MELPPCSLTWLAKIYTSITSHQLKLVRNLRTWERVTLSLIWCDLCMCCSLLGIMAGSPCPPEILRKVKTNMNMKEITVGGYISCISPYNSVKEFWNMFDRTISSSNRFVMEPLKIVLLHLWDSHKTTRSWRWTLSGVSWITQRYDSLFHTNIYLY